MADVLRCAFDFFAFMRCAWKPDPVRRGVVAEGFTVCQLLSLKPRFFSDKLCVDEAEK